MLTRRTIKRVRAQQRAYGEDPNVPHQFGGPEPVSRKEERARPPFAEGSLVTWSSDAPKTWHFIWTPGPMIVISSKWSDGAPTEYSMIFGGISRTPGWVITIEYDADSTKYYDPPLGLILGKARLQKQVHEDWLESVP